MFVVEMSLPEAHIAMQIFQVLTSGWLVYNSGCQMSNGMRRSAV